MKRRISIAGIVVALLCPSVSPALDPAVPGVEQVSTFSTDNQRAVVAASPDGSVAYVAWDGVDAKANRRIFLRERRAGIWLPPSVVDESPAGDNVLPGIAVDSNGNPHVVWLTRVAGNLRVHYKARMAGEWLDWGIVNPADGPAENSTAAVLRLDQAGLPWIAWESASPGNRYKIRVARMDPEAGAFSVSDLTRDSSNYNIMPEILFTPVPTVFWYAAVGAEFRLEAMQFDQASTRWRPFAPSNGRTLPAERMPILFQTAPGAIQAAWRGEDSEAVEGDAGLHELVMLGDLNPKAEGAGRAVGRANSILAVAATATCDQEASVVTWSADSPTSGPQVFARIVPLEGIAADREPDLLSDGRRDYYGTPTVAPVNGGAAVVWNSSAESGGSGQVFFRLVR